MPARSTVSSRSTRSPRQFRHCLPRRGSRSIFLQRCRTWEVHNENPLAGRGARGVGRAAVGAAHATDLEVTHWWTSGGEAAAVAEFAKAFDATGNKWVDGAIAGSGSTARPIMISRITGGDPMGATQFNHGRQAEELVEAGLMRDLTDLADRGELGRRRRPPVAARELHARRQDLLRAGQHPLVAVAVALATRRSRTPACRFRPTGTSSSRRRPALREAGKIPLAVGGQPWQTSGASTCCWSRSAARTSTRKSTATRTRGRSRARGRQGLPGGRRRPRDGAGSNVQDWNEATNMVITDEAGGQIMGDWAQGEFQVAGEVAGTDYTCLPGLGVNEIISPTATPSTSRCSTTRRPPRRRRC